MEPIFSKIIIVGLGLLGSSAGLAARRAGLAEDIVGLDSLRSHAEEALRLGAVDQCAETISDALTPNNPLTADCSVKPVLLIVAVPVMGIADELKRAAAAICERNLQMENASRPLYILTETASVQSGIQEEIHEEFPNNTVFIGSHPIAGSEKSGPSAGCADLFTGKRVVLVPFSTENPRWTEAFSLLERFWNRVGAETVRLSARDHDRVLAKTSHLPHLTSILLNQIPSDDELPFTGTGWGGMTRLAGSSPEVWSDIFMMNRFPILDAVHQLEELLTTWKAALNSGDRDQIFTLLEEAKKRRDALGN